jgi:fatty acid/phospholipid biosynthesis enzyme
MLGAICSCMPALKKLQCEAGPAEGQWRVFLGLNGVVVKSHGGTDDMGFEQAISVAAGMGEKPFPHGSRGEPEAPWRPAVAPAQQLPLVVRLKKAAK